LEFLWDRAWVVEVLIGRFVAQLQGKHQGSLVEMISLGLHFKAEQVRSQDVAVLEENMLRGVHRS
jgi:hypothetical protein